MYLSRKELEKYIQGIKQVSDQRITEALIAIGFEVEGICNYARLNSNLVTGHIKTITKHPNADRLNVCQVQISDQETKTIVCGAKNVTAGIKVIVALPGANLSFSKIIIEDTKIRGISSSGMICSLHELGIDVKNFNPEANEGIFILPNDAEVGDTNPLAHIGFNDTFFDLAITSNRNDCNNIYFLAKELAIKLNKKFKPIEIDLPISELQNSSHVSVNDPNCLAYYSIVLNQVKIEPSPKWLRNHLISHGISSINNIVDLTNYIMLEIGQPMHAYDKDIVGNKLFVLKGTNSEKKTLFLNNELIAPNQFTLVTNDQNILALGGIIGAKFGSITTSTQNIILEAAIWNHQTIRKTTAKLGWITRSAHLYSNALSPSNLTLALSLFAQIAKEQKWIKTYSLIAKHQDQIIHPQTIHVSMTKINQLLGIEIKKSEAIKILKSLNFEIKTNIGDRFSVISPKNRLDVHSWQDIAEEIIRIYGIETIPATPPIQEAIILPICKLIKWEREISYFLASLGFKQVKTYSLTNYHDAISNNFLNHKTIIKLRNPISSEREYFRQTLINSHIQTLIYNISRKQNHNVFFEIAQTFEQKKGVYLASKTLIITSMFSLFADLFTKDKITSDYYSMKMIVLALIEQLNFSKEDISFQQIFETNNTTFHPNKLAHIFYKQTKIGVLGTLHPKLLKQLKAASEISMCELDLTKLSMFKEKSSIFTPIPKFPTITRDFSFNLNKNINSETLLKAIKDCLNNIGEINQKIITFELNVFDLYEGKTIPLNKKSLGIELVISPKESFEDAEIKLIERAIKNHIKLNYPKEIILNE